METPLLRIEARALRNLLASFMHEAVIEFAVRRREDNGASRKPRMLIKNLCHLLWDRHRPLFPVLRQEAVLGFGGDVNLPVRKIKVRPVQRL